MIIHDPKFMGNKTNKYIRDFFFTLNCFEKKGLVLVTCKNKKLIWKTKFLLILNLIIKCLQNYKQVFYSYEEKFRIPAKSMKTLYR